MIYNLESIIKIQKELNNTIYKTQNITFHQIEKQSHLCIIIELMELCNSTRCFNYWSKKTRGTDDDILEEFADVLCFFITEIIDLNIDSVEIDDSIKNEDKLSLTSRFEELVMLYSKLDSNNHLSYKFFLEQLFNLGYALGYNIDMIIDGYNKKVLKNYKVQEEFRTN